MQIYVFLKRVSLSSVPEKVHDVGEVNSRQPRGMKPNKSATCQSPLNVGYGSTIFEAAFRNEPSLSTPIGKACRWCGCPPLNFWGHINAHKLHTGTSSRLYLYGHRRGATDQGIQWQRYQLAIIFRTWLRVDLRSMCLFSGQFSSFGLHVTAAN